MNSQKILVVEDERIAQKIAYLVLTGLGFEVTVTETAEEAFAALEKDNYHLILMDIGLPDSVKGYDAAKQIKSNPKTAHIPIVGITAHAKKTQEEKSLAAGMVEYWDKPLTRECGEHLRDTYLNK